MKPITPHWADLTAAKIIRNFDNKDSFTVASGITPSGTVHIGNFREVITVDLVARALRSAGKEVRFIYSWDDFDTFRKVPVNMPNQKEMEGHLRKSISKVPDAYGKAASYARSNMDLFEGELKKMGIFPEYLVQHERYGDGLYAEQMRKALEEKEVIKKILNRYRQTPLADDWLPTAIYCEACDKDEMVYQRYEGEWEYAYKCASCGHEAKSDIRKTKNLKLNWRTDWPMRWHYEKVDFEPGGKDHSSEGGSYDTASVIVKDVYGGRAPEYLQYDFVSIKGMEEKMSSSKGNLITLSEAMEVYEPQMIRWIFAGHRPNHDFSLSFDQDVIKTYDEFDRAEKKALGEKPAKPGNWPVVRRTYELSLVEEGNLPKEAPYRAPFRELCTRLQIVDGDIEKACAKFYADEVKTDLDRALFKTRSLLALNWLKNYAPEEFIYTLNKEPVQVSCTKEQEKGLVALRDLINKIDLEAITSKEVNEHIYQEVIHKLEIEAKDFFQVVYQRLISRDRGPRLPSFLKEIGRERLLNLLS